MMVVDKKASTIFMRYLPLYTYFYAILFAFGEEMCYI